MCKGPVVAASMADTTGKHRRLKASHSVGSERVMEAGKANTYLLPTSSLCGSQWRPLHVQKPSRVNDDLYDHPVSRPWSKVLSV